MKEAKQSLLQSKIAALTSIKIQPKITFSKRGVNQLLELKTEKERLFSHAKSIQLNSALSPNDAHEIEYLNFQVNNYPANFVENIQGESIKNTFEQLKIILSSSSCQFFNDMDYQQYKAMYNNNPEQIRECFDKYRNTLLDTLDYRTLSSQDKKLLSDFISKKETIQRSYSGNKAQPPNVNGVYSNSGTYSLFDDGTNNSNNNNNTNNSSYMPKNNINNSNSNNKNNINVVDINSMPNVANVDNTRIKRLLMFNDFRLYVKNKDLSDAQIENYFGTSNDIATAANNYFKWVNGTETISLTYVFPNQKTQVYQFKFIDPLDDLILKVYQDHPEINAPCLVLSNGQDFDFNPVEDKYIGSLFKNGSILYVRSYE